MLYLPLPKPWTADNILEYIDRLIQFVTDYGCIVEYSTHDVFTKGLAVEWAPTLELKDWIEIINGKPMGILSATFSEFAQLSRDLPLQDYTSCEVPNNRESRRGMSPKKDHEVEAMLAFLDKFPNIQQLAVRRVIDVGSGLGYLSLELAKSGYEVMGIEGDSKRAEKASQQSQFKSLNKMIATAADLDVTSEPLISVSLHACGDLSLNMINHFLCYENVKLLVNVGCCYNRLSSDGFPLSQCLRNKGVELTQHLRQIAVQATPRWTAESLAFTIRKHFYRAVLQVLFTKHNLNPTVGKMRDQHYRKSFTDYLHAVRHKLSLPVDLTAEAEIVGKYNEADMVAAVCMRAMCAAVIESLIVLDRWMYIRENVRVGYIGLHRIFNAKISPRGWAIVAARSN